MSDNIIAIEAEKHMKHQEAVELHRSVMLNADLAATSFVNFCRDLKKMRDSKLYEELGFETFEAYTTGAVGIKQRQAYNYINVYENFDTKVLEENAILGITKLGLVAQIPTQDQAAIMEDEDLANMTVEEIKAIVKGYQDQSEQLSLLETKYVELQSSSGEITEEQREAIAREAKAEAEKEYKAKIKEAKEKAAEAARKDGEAKLKEEVEKAKQQASEEVEQSIKELQDEIAASAEREQNLEKQLSITSNPTMLKFKYYFEDLQDAFGKMLTLISECSEPEDKDKLRGAMQKYFDNAQELLISNQ